MSKSQKPQASKGGSAAELDLRHYSDWRRVFGTLLSRCERGRSQVIGIQILHENGSEVAELSPGPSDAEGDWVLRVGSSWPLDS